MKGKKEHHMPEQQMRVDCLHGALKITEAHRWMMGGSTAVCRYSNPARNKAVAK